MADFIDGIFERIESVLPMEGPMAIPARFAIGAAAGWLFMEAIRPRFAYTSDGVKRPWIAVPDLYQSRGAPTWLPWFVGPLAGGFILSTFI